MSSLFTFDWDTESYSDQIAAPELAATLARLQIGIDGKFVTVAEELHNESIRRSINVSLYPLAEWIVYNWWQLLYGGRTDGSGAGEWGSSVDDHRIRANNLRSSGDGFIWPDLTISPEGGAVRLEWHSDHTVRPGRGIRYMTSGVAWAGLDWVRAAFSDLVESVLIRLDEAHIRETPLHKEWKALKALDEEEVEFCQACGRMGLDPFSEGIDLSDAIERVFSELDKSLVWDFYDAANPSRLVQNAAWVNQADRTARIIPPHSGTVDLASLTGASRSGGSPTARPWELGYSQARAIRTTLQLKPSAPFPTDQLPVTVIDLASDESSLQGFVRTGPHGGAGLVMGWNASENSRRFALGRAAWHLVFGAADQAFLLTSACSQNQQVARAFAAELLAPAEGIRAILGGVGYMAAAPMIADQFGVSDMVIEKQIENQLSGTRVVAQSRI